MEFINVPEVARVLGCSETRFRRAEEIGRIPKARRDTNGWRTSIKEDLAALRRVSFPESYDVGAGADAAT